MRTDPFGTGLNKASEKLTTCKDGQSVCFGVARTDAGGSEELEEGKRQGGGRRRGRGRGRGRGRIRRIGFWVTTCDAKGRLVKVILSSNRPVAPVPEGRCTPI